MYCDDATRHADELSDGNLASGERDWDDVLKAMVAARLEPLSCFRFSVRLCESLDAESKLNIKANIVIKKEKNNQPTNQPNKQTKE